MGRTGLVSAPAARRLGSRPQNNRLLVVMAAAASQEHRCPPQTALAGQYSLLPGPAPRVSLCVVYYLKAWWPRNHRLASHS